MGKVRQNIRIGSENFVVVENMKDLETSEFINGAVVTMSLYKEAPLNVDISNLTFTSGGVAELMVGDVIVGDIGSATAVVVAIYLTSGAWADGDAAGRIDVKNQYGTFQAEDLDVLYGQVGIASIAADSTGVVDNANKPQFYVRNHGLTTSDYVKLVNQKTYSGECDVTAVAEGLVTLDMTYSTADKCTGEEELYVGIQNGTAITLTHEASDPDGYYDGILPEEMLKLIYAGYYHLFITVESNGDTVRQRLILRAVYMPE